MKTFAYAWLCLVTSAALTVAVAHAQVSGDAGDPFGAPGGAFSNGETPETQFELAPGTPQPAALPGPDATGHAA